MCLLFAIAGVWLKGSDNNIFTQIGLIVLVGLACKNAILIIEFAKQKQEEGVPPLEAALEACRLRLRPILMTSIAFIAGVFPLVVARGAGAEMRQAMGIAVFSGMIGVTVFGLFLTPVFYVTLMTLGRKKKAAVVSTPSAPAAPLAAGGAVVGLLFLGLLFTTASSQAGPLTVGPDYQAPSNAIPAHYKSLVAGQWQEGQPLDGVPKGNWWELFGDRQLDGLENQAIQGSEDLQAALARLEESRAAARVSRADLLPHASFDPSFQRQRYSPNENPSFGSITANTINVPLDLSYEIDLWGRVRRGFESARADAQASLADYYNVLLTLQANVAQDYFSLRSLDAEIDIVNSTVGLRHEQVQLVRSRYEGGIGNELDVAQAETELATAEADAAALAQQRDQMENALAIIAGQNPADFHLSVIPASNTNWHPQPPAIPAGLPSDLLQRRPDVAQAERQLASANAKIGVAKAAFFPVLTLTGSGGYLSGDVDSLFNWSSRTWSFGPSLTLPIFAGGRNHANLQRAHAAFAESVALYRQRVLVAFGDVENSLSDIRHLADQAAAQERAVDNARRAADLATDRYRSGIVAYLTVVDAEREALDNERANAQLAGQRLIAAVQLIKALGGGWNANPGLAQTSAAPEPALSKPN
jgi:multidrug efflux system outer membrane protein